MACCRQGSPLCCLRCRFYWITFVHELYAHYGNIKEKPALCEQQLLLATNEEKDEARLSLARWYDKVDNSGFVSFNTIAGTIHEHYEEILNYFVNRSTNAFAESLSGF